MILDNVTHQELGLTWHLPQQRNMTRSELMKLPGDVQSHVEVVMVRDTQSADMMAEWSQVTTDHLADTLLTW